MDIDRRFLEFALLGSQWVLWLLVGLSVVGATVAVERVLRYRRAAAGQECLRVFALETWVATRASTVSRDMSINKLALAAEASASPAAAMLVAVTRSLHAGREAAAHMVTATRMQSRRELERYVSVLGTIGANAPFVGLFGTVLEILRVFSLIGEGGMGSTSQSMAIMAGISEALVATGVGLLVAIPAVVGYNALTGWLDSIFSQADEITEIAVALVSYEEQSSGR